MYASMLQIITWSTTNSVGLNYLRKSGFTGILWQVPMVVSGTWLQETEWWAAVWRYTYSRPDAIQPYNLAYVFTHVLSPFWTLAHFLPLPLTPSWALLILVSLMQQVRFSILFCQEILQTVTITGVGLQRINWLLISTFLGTCSVPCCC